MAVEIERKFLVAGKFKPHITSSTRITQGYLSSNREQTVRVRIMDNKGFLTIKGSPNQTGISRFEWEKEISKSDAESLLALCKKGIIDKTRYEIKVGNHIFEVDEFLGENKGLHIAEIELPEENTIFEKPGWLGKEVTGQVAYYNAMLSKKPFSIW